MRILHVSGSRGVGKSVVSWDLFSGLMSEGVLAAYVDLAQLGIQRPCDPGRMHDNLAALASNYRAVGVRWLIVSGDAEHALPAAMLCWLGASHSRLVERLLLRGQGYGPPVPGDDLRGRPADQLRHIARAAEPPDNVDVVINTDGVTVAEVAASVRAELIQGFDQ